MSDAPEMVDRVAEAIRAEFAKQRISPWGGIDLSSVIPPVNWTAVGTAAIEAMREPTEEMLSAAREPPFRTDVETHALRRGAPYSLDDLGLGPIYTRMIDAALK